MTNAQFTSEDRFLKFQEQQIKNMHDSNKICSKKHLETIVNEMNLCGQEITLDELTSVAQLSGKDYFDQIDSVDIPYPMKALYAFAARNLVKLNVRKTNEEEPWQFNELKGLILPYVNYSLCSSKDIILYKGQIINEKNEESTNSIDSMVKYNNLTILITQKCTVGPGGAQQKQYDEMLKFIDNCPCINDITDIYTVACVTGSFWTHVFKKRGENMRKNNIQRLREYADKKQKRFEVGSIEYIADYINEIINND